MDRPHHPRLAILTMALSAWLFILGGGITNIALPYLTDEFGVVEAQVVWITVAFQLAAVSCTIPLAGLSETVGIRNTYVAGLVVYGLGSISCGLAGDFTQLTIARVLQGLGAAAMSSANAPLLRRCVPDKMLGRVLSMFAVIVGAAQGAAPIIGSTILYIASWRWLFFYDLPITLTALALALYALPRDKNIATRFDYASAFLTIPTLGLSFYALDRLARDPGAPVIYGMLGIALISGVLLERRQRGRDRPLFPVDLFRLPRFVLPGAVSALTFGAQATALTALPFLFVSSLDMTLLSAGALISILPLVTLMMAPVSGYLSDRFIMLPLSTFGCLLMAGGFAGIWAVADTHSQALITVMLVLLGAGFAFFQNHNSKVMILAAPLNRMGAAGGVQSTSRVVGMMAGPALVGICFHAFGDRGTLAAILLGLALSLIAATCGAIATVLNRRDCLRGP
ncbi:MFS transporter [Phaeobacter sp. CAU 1743]|uniref:MFS transporter n=1 Tax=Phaeobacter sp. CAU 1743 TaxID=3140367 RepID=UPI0023B4F2AB